MIKVKRGQDVASDKCFPGYTVEETKAIIEGERQMADLHLQMLRTKDDKKGIKMIKAKLKTWVLCCKPRPDHSGWNDEIHYWSGKGNGGHWTDDLSQATHYPNKGRAKGTMTQRRKKYKRCTWLDFTDEDRMFIGEIDATVQINETGDE